MIIRIADRLLCGAGLWKALLRFFVRGKEAVAPHLNSAAAVVKRTRKSPPEQRLICTSRMVQLDSMMYALSPTFMGLITSLLSYDISIATFFGHDRVKAKTPDHFLAECSFLFLGLEFFLFAQANHFPNLLIFRSGFVPGLFEVGIHFSQQLYRF